MKNSKTVNLLSEQLEINDFYDKLNDEWADQWSFTGENVEKFRKYIKFYCASDWAGTR